jgi:hypothetical protein
MFSLMKWVTGQVRCQVTGKKPTRSRMLADDRSGQVSQTYNKVIAATQPAAPSRILVRKVMSYSQEQKSPSTGFL